MVRSNSLEVVLLDAEHRGVVFADQSEQLFREEVDQFAAFLQQFAFLHVLVVDSHPFGEQIQHQAKQFDRGEDSGVIVQQYPVSDDFALDFCQLHLSFLSYWVALGEFSVEIVDVFLHVFFHFVEHAEVLHRSTDSHMQEL